MKRIEKVCPTRGIRHVAVVCDQGVVKMKGMIDRGTEEQRSRQNQSCRDFHVIVAGSDYMRVAIVHDWLNGMRGGEKVLEALLELFPESTIYTLFHQRGKVSPVIESYPIVTSWMNCDPGGY